MISPDAFLASLESYGVDFIAGVPDSLLKDFLLVVQEKSRRHYICANEGGAVALAAGYHLATGKIPLVYMQNSGLGNAVNPLLSLTHEKVYSIPLLLLIGWRGKPGEHDEPQHRAMGECTLAMLENLGVGHEILSADSDFEKIIDNAIATLKKKSSPYALVSRKGAFAQAPSAGAAKPGMSRQAAIEALARTLLGKEAVVATTGYTARELYQIRKEISLYSDRDFLNVGAMGHASQIALGIALSKPAQQVICLDGDGSSIMHMGSFATVGNAAPNNFKHIVLNNGVHDSVGGQPTAGFSMNIPAMAIACGYKKCRSISAKPELGEALSDLLLSPGPALLEIRIRPGAPDNLVRPPEDFAAQKNAFMAFLRKS